MDEIKNKYLNEKFDKISPTDFAEKLREQFAKNPELWYKVITPAKIADELRIKTNNDYSQIWETYCDNCFT
ncbi:MAG: hypothetical protein K2M48_02960, partial [Clostridiales bacterium]|nr:hypothetical protein [Clostridiales bacterium]